MESRTLPPSSQRTYYLLVMSSALIFLVLPFVTTFNELLTVFVMRIRLYVLIEDFVVPLEARVVAGLFSTLFGVNASVADKSILLQYGGRNFLAYIGWNCIGWQSLILFALTTLTGLRGEYTSWSKLKAALIGIQGTILLNIGRILLILVVAMFWGYLPSLIIHDYLGTLMLLVWLVGFWHISYNYILQPLRSNA